MADTIKIEGLRDLDRALSQFTKSTARGVLNRTLKKAAQPIADQARMDAPVDTGELRDSINIRVKGAGGSAGKAAFAAAMRVGATHGEAASLARAANREAGSQPMSATVSIGADAPHAVFAEFGARGKPGNAFLTAAMRSRARDALALVGKELKTEIDKTAKRVAARAAKKGTK
jgi:HK97 gp10 family phage protein